MNFKPSYPVAQFILFLSSLAENNSTATEMQRLKSDDRLVELFFIARLLDIKSSSSGAVLRISRTKPLPKPDGGL